MKKLKLTGRLSLKKESIARLTSSQMNALKGGDHLTYTCPSNAPTQTSCSCENCTNGACSTGC